MIMVVSADGLAPLGASPFAGTVMTNLGVAYMYQTCKHIEARWNISVNWVIIESGNDFWPVQNQAVTKTHIEYLWIEVALEQASVEFE